MKTIREILTGRKPLSKPGSSSALEAARAMQAEQVGAVLVVDAQGNARGIFTERDLMVRVIVAGKQADAVRIEEVMSTDLFQCGPERHVNEMAREMQARHIRHLPVFEDGQLLGLLSLRDLLRAHLEIKREEVRVLHAYIKGEEPG